MENATDHDYESMEHCKKAYDRLVRIYFNVLLPNDQIPGNLVLVSVETPKLRHTIETVP